MRAVFLDFGTVSHDDLDTTSLERVLPGITLYPTSSDAEVDERIAGCEFILTNKLNISRARMRAVPGLRFVGLTATGTNNVDLEAARELGVAVCNIREYCTVSVVQHVLGVMLALTHRLREYGQAAVDGTWAKCEQFSVPGAPIRELSGKVLGIVGFGTLGRAVAKAAQAALGMRVLVAQRAGSSSGTSRDADTTSIIGPVRVTLDELLRSADVLSLHCPLTPATTGLIGRRELSLMKPEALLINTARGALVDLDALVDALRGGDLGGAAIDVLPQEPPVKGSPLFAPDIPNLIVTPHIAWAAFEARQRAVDELALNIEDFLRGGRRGRVV
ncbi:MAG TPA: D-2-hydroxyacid dehydrogenase [Steroidobacteraceae bacterium]|jgi:glycerate dehydrogenase|nr:D-2-hydroxyacid dehydrogenase [Steroidobacteraceae bacterium]